MKADWETPNLTGRDSAWLQRSKTWRLPDPGFAPDAVMSQIQSRGHFLQRKKGSKWLEEVRQRPPSSQRPAVNPKAASQTHTVLSDCTSSLFSAFFLLKDTPNVLCKKISQA
jgi:hypothetical protein